jgi:hypothetical protein
MSTELCACADFPYCAHQIPPLHDETVSPHFKLSNLAQAEQAGLDLHRLMFAKTLYQAHRICDWCELPMRREP